MYIIVYLSKSTLDFNYHFVKSNKIQNQQLSINVTN